LKDILLPKIALKLSWPASHSVKYTAELDTRIGNRQIRFLLTKL